MSFKVAVVGVGRMGRLHARVISEMPQAELVCIVDSNPAAAKTVAKQRNCLALTSPEQAVEKVDAAIIATPTVSHFQAAEPFLQAGVPVLIEKPIAETPEVAEKLIALAQQRNVSVQIGHTERFNPAVVALREHDIRPKFIEAHRISPFTFRSGDVGVVLDMMIHDIDLVGMLVGDELVDVQSVGVNVLGKTEDICNARLRFANGCVANLTASRLAIKTERKMRLFSEEAYLSVDYGKKVGIVIRKDRNLDLLGMAREMDVESLAELAENVDYTKLLNVEELVIDDSTEPLRQQVEAFRKTVQDGAEPVCSAAEGLEAVRTAKRIVDSLRDHRWDGQDAQRTGPDILKKS